MRTRTQSSIRGLFQQSPHCMEVDDQCFLLLLLSLSELDSIDAIVALLFVLRSVMVPVVVAILHEERRVRHT